MSQVQSLRQGSPFFSCVQSHPKTMLCAISILLIIGSSVGIGFSSNVFACAFGAASLAGLIVLGLFLCFRKDQVYQNTEKAIMSQNTPPIAFISSAESHSNFRTLQISPNSETNSTIAKRSHDSIPSKFKSLTISITTSSVAGAMSPPSSPIYNLSPKDNSGLPIAVVNCIGFSEHHKMLEIPLAGNEDKNLGWVLNEVRQKLNISGSLSIRHLRKFQWMQENPLQEKLLLKDELRMGSSFIVRKLDTTSVSPFAPRRPSPSSSRRFSFTMSPTLMVQRNAQTT